MSDLSNSGSSSANISIQFQNNQSSDAGIAAPSPASASNMALLSESKVPDRPARRIVPLSCGVESLRGKRQTMEDKCTVLQHPMFSAQCKVPTDHATPRSFFAVYDGHGGEVCAEYCRRYLHGNMVIQDSFLRDPAQALRAAVVQTENNFQDAARKAHLESTSGTCAIIAYIECDQLIIANVGDSRAVLCSKGKAVGLSSDHKPGRPDERKRIEERGGAVARADHEAANPPSDFCFWLSNCCLCPCLYMGPLRVYPGGLAVSRSIGDVGLKNGSLIIADPEMTVHTITDKDEFLILACDGVWDVLSNQESVAIVREALRSGKTASQASSVLAQRAIAKGSLDNVSTIVVVFAEEAVFARAPSANRS